MSGEHLTDGAQQYVRHHRLLPLCLAILCAAPQVLFAVDDKEVQGAKKSAEQPKKIPSQGADKARSEAPHAPVDAKARKSNLTIVVSRGKKPSEQAEVRITPVPQPGEKKTGEMKRFTDAQGQTVLSELDVGTVEVLVIAKGWKTSRQQVTLKAGENHLKIELEPL